MIIVALYLCSMCVFLKILYSFIFVAINFIKIHLILKILKYNYKLCAFEWVDIYAYIVKFRRILASLRIGAHCLSIAQQQQHQLDEHECLCPYCEIYIENVFNFIFVCPLYNLLESSIYNKPYTQILVLKSYIHCFVQNQPLW